MNTAEPAIATHAASVDVTAMPAPRKVETRQPELALAAANATEQRAATVVPSAVKPPQFSPELPVSATRLVDAQTLATASQHATDSPTPAANPRTSSPKVEPKAVDIAVKIETGSRPTQARETTLALNAPSISSARAPATAGANAQTMPVDLQPQQTRDGDAAHSLTVARTTETSSLVQIHSAPSPAKLDGSTAMTDVKSPDVPSIARAASDESALNVAVSGSAAPSRTSPTTLVRANDPQAELSPDESDQNPSAQSQSLASTQPALAGTSAASASISITSPLAAASPSNAALPDLSLPAGALTRPAAGHELAPSLQIAAAPMRERADTPRTNADLSTEPVVLQPIAARASDSETSAVMISSAVPRHSTEPAVHLASPALPQLSAAANSIDVSTPAANQSVPRGNADTQQRIAAIEAEGSALVRAEAATPVNNSQPAIELSPLDTNAARGSTDSMAAAINASASEAVASAATPSASVFESTVQWREVEPVPLAIPQGRSDVAAAAELDEFSPHRPRSSASNPPIAKRRTDDDFNARATAAPVQVQPNSTTALSGESSMVEIHRSKNDTATRPQSIAASPILAMTSPAELDIATPQDAPVVAENPYPQRAEDVRKELVKRGGGSEATEKAVALALEWLSKHQAPDGRWAARDFDKTCNQCDGRGKFDTDVATTGLALLCFLGADHTHMKDGQYRQQIQRALDWMLTQQKEDGDWRGGETMYSHGIATIAVCEAYAMTGDLKLKNAVKNAVDYIWLARNRNVGGWRYEPGQVGDTSVLGWQIMALMSAKRAGFFVPAEAFEMARHWLDLSSTPARPGLYAYQPGQRFTNSMTAEGMFIQQLSGRDRNENRMIDSADFLMQHLPVWRSDQSSYFWYYGTLALFQHQGEHWQRWNKSLTEQLLANQQTEGHEAGSWNPVDNWAKIGGRVYQTALCTLCLEVYYRYLPMYAAVEEES
jgi:hypothetical protein